MIKEFIILFLVSIFEILAILGIYKIVRFIYLYNFSLVGRFRRAMRNGELRIGYQPIVDITTGVWCGAEALLRWDNKGLSISPALFLPLIEKFGMMSLATRWMCERVVEDYSSLICATEDLYISINLSPQDVLDPTFPQFMQKLLAQYQVPASRVVLEVTEGRALTEEKAILQLSRLRAQGHKIALDDFGTGYSSLSYLEFFTLDILKIDRSFLVVEDGGRGDIVLSNILNLANDLDLMVIVEGVERVSQVDRLLLLGVKFSQGFFYSGDLSADQLVREYFSLKRPDKDHPI